SCVAGQELFDQVRGVRSMVDNALLRLGRLIQGLLAKVDVCTADAPVLQAGDAVLAMEFSIPEVARVAVCPGPDLLAGAIVAPKDGDLTRSVADPVGLERGAGVGLRILSHGHFVAPLYRAVEANRLARRLSDRASAFDRVRLAEEDFEPLTGQERFQPRPPQGSIARFLVRRAIGALRQPDRLRLATEPAAIDLDTGPDLTVDRRIAAKQWQVSVRGSTGGDFDVAGVLQLLERGEDVAVVPIAEVRQMPRIPMVIELGQFLGLLTALFLEAGYVI